MSRNQQAQTGSEPIIRGDQIRSRSSAQLTYADDISQFRSFLESLRKDLGALRVLNVA